MANVAKDLAQIISQSKSTKTGPYDTQAVVKRIEGNTVWVSIPGGIDETPIEKTINCTAGDKVQVRVSGGRAWITGNASAPPTDDTTAIKADTTATAAQIVAADAKATADAVEGIAEAAQASATTAANAAASAVIAAGNAQTAANSAQSSADNASEYAARALGNLSTVQSVAETLTWITAHGTMTLTTDVTPDPTHVYFVVDAGGDYTVNGVTYAIVTEPDVADMGTYYELSIDESLNNYVGTHLALDSEGLWLLPAASGTNKVLIATGAGSTYTVAGTYLVDSGGSTVASFRQDGATMSSGGTQIAHLGYGPGNDSGGGTSDAPYYTLGTRTGTIGNYSVAEGEGSEASGYVSHAEGGICKATGTYSHAEGFYNTASKTAAHAEGSNCTASDNYAHAEGSASTASGDSSHAEGTYTTASGKNSHAQNLYTKASSDNQTALGKCNVEDNADTYAVIVGNGTADNARSNAFTVDWSGNVEAAGDVSAADDFILTANDNGLYGTKTDGTTQRILIGMSNANNIAVGYDSYSNADGNLNLYGDGIALNSNTTITANQTITVGGNPMGLVAEDKLLTDNATISGNSYGNNSASVSKTGYTPIGIVGMHLQNATSSGTNNTQCAVHSFYLSGTTAYWIVRNTSSASAKIKVTATILYVKS